MTTEQFNMEDLNENQREIAEIVGMENYLKLVRRFGGDNIYIQKYSEMLRPSRDREIMEKFTGFNYQELADEYDLTVRTIYKLVSPMINAKRSAPIDGQMGFDDLTD